MDNNNPVISEEIISVSYIKQKRIIIKQQDLMADNIKVDVLLCSAFCDDYFPSARSLIGALYNNGISIQNMAKNSDKRFDVYDENNRRRCWISKESEHPRFKRIACVELLSYTDYKEGYIKGHIDYLKNVFSMLRQMFEDYDREGMQLRKIAMIIPGIGDQGLEIEYVVSVLFSQLRLMLKNIEQLEDIIIYDRNPSKTEFLRSYIQDKKTLNGKQVFISYSSIDSIWAEKIFNNLKNIGLSCWKAPEDIPPGSNYQKEIPKGLRETYILVAVLTENSERSKWCYKEIGTAIGSGHIVVPVKIQNYTSSEQFRFLMEGEQIFPAYEYIDEEGEIKMLEKLSKIILRYKQNHDVFVG